METATWEPSENIEAGLLRFALFNINNFMPDAVPYCPIVNLMILTPQSTLLEVMQLHCT